MNIEKDIKQIIFNELTKFGFKCSTDEKLEQLLGKFSNTKMKSVLQYKREVYKSKELVSKKLDPIYENALGTIENKIRNGDDVNCHLSKKVLKPDYTDLLLCDWAIHHFHLSTTKKNPNSYFFDRSDYLLFTMITRSEAYFIDVLKHRENYLFAKKYFLEVINNNWPNLLEPYRLIGFNVPKKFTDKDIKMLRESGVNSIPNISGKVYVPMGGGITLAGSSLKIQMDIIYIKKWIKYIKKYINNNRDYIKNEIKRQTGKKIKKLNIKVNFENDKFILKEESTGAIIEV